VIFELFTAAVMMMMIMMTTVLVVMMWVLAPCGLNGARTQKKIIILSTVKTTNLTCYHPAFLHMYVGISVSRVAQSV
jgi:uracil DNA glycosylase